MDKVAVKHPLRAQSGHCHLMRDQRGDPDHREEGQPGGAVRDTATGDLLKDNECREKVQTIL